MTRTQSAEADDQGRVLSLLGAPSTHGGQPVQRIDTHGAIVFLAGPRAYKVKRAVRLPYMDFSTLQRRREALEAELRLNRRTAPDLYEAVVPVVRTGGRLRLGEEGKDGPVAEWVLVMRRFDEDQVLDRLADRGDLALDLMPALAEAVADLHEAAEPYRDRGGTDALRRVARINAGQLRQFPDLFAAPAVDAWDAGVERALVLYGPLLERRRDAGYVRHCHGDLHLRNICLIEGRPTLFDALEFDPSLAITDVMYDLAYLLMDLDHRHRRDAANAVLNQYLETTADYAGLAPLPLFLSLRASVRAHVSATSLAAAAPADRPALRREAVDYFQEAVAYLQPAGPRLVAVGGLSGTGKTTLARRLAPATGPAPGAVVLRSDVLRKRMMGVSPLQKLPPAAYEETVTRHVYDEIDGLAGLILEAGHAVIADAVFALPAQRQSIERRAGTAGVRFTGLWLVAGLDTQLQRVGARRNDASDADAAVVRQQSARDTGPMTWHILHSDGQLGQVAAHAATLIEDPDAAPGDIPL